MNRENILCGKKVKLAAISDEDLQSASEWYQDAGFLRMYDSEPAYPRTAKQLADRIKGEQERKDTFLFAIRLLETERIIGILALDGIAWTHGTSFVSIGIGEKADRGQGYGREAMSLTLKFAFHELNLHRVCLTVFSYNKVAIAMYESLGFRHEGTFREHLRRDDQRHDMHLYGLLHREWKEHQAQPSD